VLEIAIVIAIEPFKFSPRQLNGDLAISHIWVILDKKAMLSQRCPCNAQSDNFDRFAQSDSTHMVRC